MLKQMGDLKIMRNTIATVSAALALFLSSAASAEPMTVDSVIALAKVGVGDEAIIAKIRSEKPTFDLSTDQMITLKQQGVSSAVIAAMINPSSGSAPTMSMDSADWRVPHPTGVYALSGEGTAARMTRIDPTVSSQAKTGGIWGYAFTGGLASMSIKVAIANESARMITGGSPHFYMFFDESNNQAAASSMSSGANASATSPAEFTLIKLMKKDGRREARVGSTNIGGTKVGVMDKDRFAFTHEMLRPGVYKIDVSTLSPGEYAFVLPITGGGTGGAMTAKLFDFSVR